MPRSVITLTTDFGPSSPYVAQMKGVILGIYDDVDLVDITHAIPPQQILAGAVALVDSYSFFPAGTIHIAVVDPGVGTARAVVLTKIDGHLFVAPDNGLLGLVARRTMPSWIVRLEARQFWNSTISPTFHGRDIMAPVAAHFASGVNFEQFGPLQTTLDPIDFPDPIVGRQMAQGIVLTVDSFGNSVTNLGADLPPAVASVSLQIDDRPAQKVPIVQTYAERQPGEVVVLIGSHGHLEVAVVNGNASERLGAVPGSQIRLQWKI